MTTWQFGGFAPTFIGPDLSPYNIVQTFSGLVLNGGALFTLDFGVKSYTNQGATPVGLTLNAGTGKYTAAGAVTPGTYAMILRCSGNDSPPSYTDYPHTLIVNTTGGGNPPIFAGPIDDQVSTGDLILDTAPFATGATSYAISSSPAGFSYNTGTGRLTVTKLTSGTGLFGPFTITYANAAGNAFSNQFLVTMLVADTPGDFSDVTLQALLDPQNNGTGILIVQRHVPSDATRVCYAVRPRQATHGVAKWVECLATDDSAARANKILLAIALPAQPIWPLN